MDLLPTAVVLLIAQFLPTFERFALVSCKKAWSCIFSDPDLWVYTTWADRRKLLNSAIASGRYYQAKAVLAPTRALVRGNGYSVLATACRVGNLNLLMSIMEEFKITESELVQQHNLCRHHLASIKDIVDRSGAMWVFISAILSGNLALVQTLESWGFGVDEHEHYAAAYGGSIEIFRFLQAPPSREMLYAAIDGDQRVMVKYLYGKIQGDVAEGARWHATQNGNSDVAILIMEEACARPPYRAPEYSHGEFLTAFEYIRDIDYLQRMCDATPTSPNQFDRDVHRVQGILQKLAEYGEVDLLQLAFKTLVSDPHMVDSPGTSHVHAAMCGAVQAKGPQAAQWLLRMYPQQAQLLQNYAHLFRYMRTATWLSDQGFLDLEALVRDPERAELQLRDYCESKTPLCVEWVLDHLQTTKEELFAPMFEQCSYSWLSDACVHGYLARLSKLGAAEALRKLRSTDESKWSQVISYALSMVSTLKDLRWIVNNANIDLATIGAVHNSQYYYPDLLWWLTARFGANAANFRVHMSDNDFIHYIGLMDWFAANRGR